MAHYYRYALGLNRIEYFQRTATPCSFNGGGRIVGVVQSDLTAMVPTYVPRKGIEGMCTCAGNDGWDERAPVLWALTNGVRPRKLRAYRRPEQIPKPRIPYRYRNPFTPGKRVQDSESYSLGLKLELAGSAAIWAAAFQSARGKRSTACSRMSIIDCHTHHQDGVALWRST